jgi:hypothetical protein
MEITYQYKYGSVDASDLAELARESLRELRDGGSAASEARAAGFDVEGFLCEPEAEQRIRIEPGESGFEPTSILVVLGGKVAYDLWRKLVLPRIERKWGGTALGPEVEGPQVPPGDPAPVDDEPEEPPGQ